MNLSSEYMTKSQKEQRNKRNEEQQQDELLPKLPFDEYKDKKNIHLSIKMNLTKKNLREHFSEDEDFIYEWLDNQVDFLLTQLKEC